MVNKLSAHRDKSGDPILGTLRVLVAEFGWIARGSHPSDPLLWTSLGASCSKQSDFRRSRSKWCRRRDLNPHALRRLILNQVRLPIPPLRHRGAAQTRGRGPADQQGTQQHLAVDEDRAFGSG